MRSWRRMKEGRIRFGHEPGGKGKMDTCVVLWIDVSDPRS